MRKGFFYTEGNAVVLRDKKALLAEIDREIMKASAKPRMRTVYEVHISVRYERGYRTRSISEESGEKYFEAIEKRNKFAWETSEYKKLDLKVSAIQKEVESGISLTEKESANISSRKVPYYSVEFKVGNGSRMNIYKSKKVLNAFRKRVEGTPATCAAIATLQWRPKKYAKLNPGKSEIIEDLFPVKQKGWFTDGHVLIKGEPPKGKEVPKVKRGRGNDISGLGMEYEKTHPTELQYYYLVDSESRIVSKDPILQLSEDVYTTNVLFRTGKNYVSFIQGKFRAIANRFPDAEYRIQKDSGMLVAYRNEKPMAGVMKVLTNRPVAKKFPELESEPAMKTEAIKARFLKRKALKL